MKDHYTRSWRWLALPALLLSIGLTVVYTFLPGDAIPVSAIFGRHEHLFIPATYTFAVVAIIAASLLVYAGYQLLPAQRHIPIYDKIAQPIVFSSLLTMVWLYTFTQEYLFVAWLVQVGQLILSLVIFTRIRNEMNTTLYRQYKWIQLPFTTAAAWLTFSTIVYAGVWLKSIGYEGVPFGENVVAVLAVLAVALLANAVRNRYHDFIFPLTIAWCCIGIYAEQRNAEKLVALVALSTGIYLVARVMIAAVRQSVVEVSRVYAPVGSSGVGRVPNHRSQSA
ncbi:hypothetical protein KK062_06100 [Fulvivirgaceae bacterium PWU5]|uniref:Uncharacterized protein n=1 Tax=Dawidia cretensis TaxID=2782350 RepID=A0AAP2DX95_9BACT|nr:hypothetical protein [Dawidia cretensis]MBT1707782.1 hypothetical protein [Dawidia cretensis]